MVYSLPGVEVLSNKPATVKISHRGEEKHNFHWEFTINFEVIKKISLDLSKLNRILNDVKFYRTSLSKLYFPVCTFHVLLTLALFKTF